MDVNPENWLHYSVYDTNSTMAIVTHEEPLGPESDPAGIEGMMSVQVVDNQRIVSDRSDHHARSVGDGGWVVSFLPGRTLTLEQAVAAMQVAEVVGELAKLTHLLGLTPLEAVGHAVWGD